jgi:hypothetical protein
MYITRDATRGRRKRERNMEIVGGKRGREGGRRKRKRAKGVGIGVGRGEGRGGGGEGREGETK